MAATAPDSTAPAPSSTPTDATIVVLICTACPAGECRMNAPCTPSIATAASPTQKLTATKVGPDGTTQPASAPATSTAPNVICARKMPATESSSVLRPAMT